jgi:hypothetical protein
VRLAARGRSTLALEAVIVKSIAISGTAMAAAAAIWVLAPPFPKPESLMQSSLPVLTTRFGSPHEMSQGHLPTGLARSVSWQDSRVIANWTLAADWIKPPVIATSSPDAVSRCLQLNFGPRWLGTALFLPCRAVVRARLAPSNIAFERTRRE